MLWKINSATWLLGNIDEEGASVSAFLPSKERQAV
jgi:hypothetical protein